MKKVLSLVLAVMMVVGMTTVAFAALANATVTEEQAWGILTPGTPKIVTLNDIDNDAVIVASSVLKFTVEAVVSQPSGAPVDKAAVTAFFKTMPVASLIEDATTARVTLDLGGAAIPAGDYTIKGKVADSGASTAVDYDKITFTVAAEKEEEEETETGTYDKVPSNWRIKELSDAGSWTAASKIDIDSKDKLPITFEMFNWEVKDSKGKYNRATDEQLATLKAGASLRSSHLSNVGVRRVYQKGTSNTIDSVDIKVKDGKSYVQVETVDYYVSTKATDVELKLALTYKSKTSGIEAYYTFTMENAKETIEEGQNEAFSYGHVFLEAESTVRDVEFETDEDGIVFMTKTVVKGQKYYANVTSEISSADSKIIEANPEVDSIYTVRQVNMANATVQFKNLDREFFVYNQDGKLLGTTKDKKLPLANKYILTTAKVDFGGEDEPVVDEPAEEPADVDAPPMGGGEVPPSNSYNPNTGL